MRALTALVGFFALGAAAGCQTPATQSSDRARENILGKWRSIAFFSAEPIDWTGTYDFKPTGDVEIHGAWKDPITGEARHEDQVWTFEVRDGRIAISGEEALANFRADGRLELIRPARVRVLGAFMQSMVVLERVEAGARANR
jgi:hypothetical protein